MTAPAAGEGSVVGRTLSHYRVSARIGAGGMGEVYRATDTRLEREVAIKILPATHARSPEFQARFEREAKAISSLNHPHVCTLHDVGCEGDVRFLVMELIEGESLADRVKKGPLPLEDVLRYGAQIADALEAAHRHGIVHRDLKPGNVMLTKSGAKLLDFGLARSGVEAISAISAPSTVQTEHKPLTTQGTIVGTFQYMAPEQLEGLEADARTDIFALGSVLYEMATGQRAFRGESKTSLIAAIVSSQPLPVSQVVKTTPPALDHVIRTCLAKDPDERWQSARDVKSELLWIAEGGSQAGAPAVVVSRRRWRERIAWGLATFATAVAAVAVLAAFRARIPAPAQGAVRFEVQPPPGTSFPENWWGSPSVSPDGRHLAFAARETSGRQRLWIRRLDSVETRPIEDSENYGAPFWSPDSRQIGFTSNNALKIADIAGGAARIVVKPAFFGGAWGRDGVILFNPGTSDGGLGALHRVSVTGGATQAVTVVDASRGETGHCCPQFLPDGRFLYLAMGKSLADSRLYVASLGSTAVTPAVVGWRYAAPGYMLESSAPKRALLATPLEVGRLEPKGPPVPVTSDSLAPFGSTETGWFSTSDTGVLAYRVSARRAGTPLVWYDRTGRPIGTVAAPEGAQSPELSPDGHRLLFERRNADTGIRDVWMTELDRGVDTRLSFDEKVDESDPLWSPDGRRVIWSKRAERQTFVEIPSQGGEAGTLFDFGNATTWPWSFSPDGRYLLHGMWSAAGQGDLMVLRLEKGSKPEPFVATPFIEMGGQFSPDGRFVVYSSDETGRPEVYLRPFPAAPGKWRVSTAGGTNPRWRGDERELFYLAPDRTLMSVALTQGSGPPSLSAPRPLFQTRISGGLGRDVRTNYAVARDGQRFLIVTDTEDTAPPPITVILNWPALLQQGKP